MCSLFIFYPDVWNNVAPKTLHAAYTSETNTRNILTARDGCKGSRKITAPVYTLIFLHMSLDALPARCFAKNAKQSSKEHFTEPAQPTEHEAKCANASQRSERLSARNGKRAATRCAYADHTAAADRFLFATFYTCAENNHNMMNIHIFKRRCC